MKQTRVFLTVQAKMLQIKRNLGNGKFGRMRPNFPENIFKSKRTANTIENIIYVQTFRPSIYCSVWL